MALGNVTRWSMFPVVVCFAFAQGCGSGDDDSSSGGCTKDTDCINGRICESGKCTDVGAVLGGSSGSAGTSGGSTAKGGTGGQGGSGGSTGGSSGTSGTSGQGGSASGSGGSSGSGGTSGTAGTCSDTDPITCPTTDSMTLCVNGALQTQTCDDFCTSIGFPTGPCSEPDGCNCDLNTMTDAACTDVMNTYCSCLDFTTSPCTSMPDQTDPNSIILYPPYIYAICHVNMSADATFLRCLHDAMPTTLDTCQTAFTNCTPAM